MKYKVRDKFKSIDTSYPDIEIIRVLTDRYCVNDDSGYIDYFFQDMIEEKFTKIEDTSQVGGDHYSSLKIDPYEYSMVNGLNPLQMNAIKYITRYKDKNGIEDLN